MGYGRERTAKGSWMVGGRRAASTGRGRTDDDEDAADGRSADARDMVSTGTWLYLTCAHVCARSANFFNSRVYITLAAGARVLLFTPRSLLVRTSALCVELSASALRKQKETDADHTDSNPDSSRQSPRASDRRRMPPNASEDRRRPPNASRAQARYGAHLPGEGAGWGAGIGSGREGR